MRISGLTEEGIESDETTIMIIETLNTKIESLELKPEAIDVAHRKES